ncbi:MAG: hypothetical protein FIA82_00355 [Melioribacter sp.]|nr:hypothetical protein [Melioribacter sp.]
MNYEREKAVGQFLVLKKQIYELGIKAQSFVNDIQQEINSFDESEKDFSNMDFKKVRTLSNELIKLQAEYDSKKKEMLRLKETYNIEE